jgi:hypothetical protein
MSTITTQQRNQDVVTPMLVDSIPATNGHYQVQLVWNLDPGTNLPNSVQQIVTLGD